MTNKMSNHNTDREFKMRLIRRHVSAKHRKLVGAMWLSVMALLSACNSQNKADVDATQPDGLEAPIAAKIEQDVQQSRQITSTVAENHSELLKGISATVFKDAKCGCCNDWIDYAQKAGMQTSVQHPKNLAVFKDRYGVPKQMRSCHTTVTEEGFVFEGHVPAKFIAQFMANPPSEAIGLTVPNMPVGSPGMEYDNQFKAYTVYQINKDGSTVEYAKVEAPEQQL